MEVKKDKIPKNYSFRHGCFWCKMPLKSFKEKVTRSCDACARKTLNSFDKIAKGKIKEGFKEVKETVFGSSAHDQAVGEAKIKAALNKKREKIKKKLRGKGLSEFDIEESLKKFDESVK